MSASALVLTMKCSPSFAFLKVSIGHLFEELGFLEVVGFQDYGLLGSLSCLTILIVEGQFKQVVVLLVLEVTKSGTLLRCDSASKRLVFILDVKDELKPIDDGLS